MCNLAVTHFPNVLEVFIECCANDKRHNCSFDSVIHVCVVELQVWEGKDVVATGRVMLGETNPLSSKPGTIRGDYCIEVGR